MAVVGMGYNLIRPSDRRRAVLGKRGPGQGAAVARSARAKRADQLETWLAAAAPKGKGSLEVLIRDGKGAAILTAVHAVRHWRFGQWKYPDRFTGPLAIEAAREVECRALVVAAPAFEDGNHDEVANVKVWLRRLADKPGSYVLDVHGMKGGDVDIVIGTAFGATPPRLIAAVTTAATNAGFTHRVVDEGPLSGGRSVTVTAWSMRELKVPAVQLELGPTLRDTRTHPLAFDRAVHFASEVVRAYGAE